MPSAIGSSQPDAGQGKVACGADDLAHMSMAEEVRMSRRRLTDGSMMRGTQRKYAYVGQFRSRLENGPCLHATDRLEATVGGVLARKKQRRLGT